MILEIDSTTLDALGARAPEPIALADGDHLDWVRNAAETIEASGASRAELVALDAAADPNVPIAVRLALKLAASRAAVRELREPAHLSVVLAVYKEHTRILRPDEHEHGEDFLRRKLDQLGWLFERTPWHTWDLTVVDDGCPERSGDLAQAVLNETPDVDTRVLFLADAIEEGLPIIKGLTSTDDSRKGGSIRYGMWEASRHDRPNHVILFTDADLSTHLAQAGLLMDPIIREGRNAAIGSRRHPASVVLKEGSRNNRGKLRCFRNANWLSLGCGPILSYLFHPRRVWSSAMPSSPRAGRRAGRRSTSSSRPARSPVASLRSSCTRRLSTPHGIPATGAGATPPCPWLHSRLAPGSSSSWPGPERPMGTIG